MNSSLDNGGTGPTSPSAQSADGFSADRFELLIEENEMMLHEIEQLRAANKRTADLQKELEATKREKEELQKELDSRGRELTMVREAKGELEKRWTDRLEDIQASVHELVAHTSRDASPEAANNGNNSNNNEVALNELHEKLAKTVNDYGFVKMENEQLKNELKVAEGKMNEARQHHRTALQENRDLIVKFGVSSEEAKRIQDRVQKLMNSETNRHHTMATRLDNILTGPTEVSKHKLKLLFSEILDQQDRSEQEARDRLTARELSWKDEEKMYQDQIRDLKKYVAELETDLKTERTQRMTLRRDPSNGNMLVTPRTDRTTPAMVQQDLQQVVSTPRFISSAGYIKKCPKCSYMNDGSTNRCQLCREVLPSV